MDHRGHAELPDRSAPLVDWFVHSHWVALLGQFELFDDHRAEGGEVVGRTATSAASSMRNRSKFATPPGDTSMS